MERLTKLSKDGKRYVSAIGSGYGCWPQIIQRLAAYENTGLEPELIEKIKPLIIAFAIHFFKKALPAKNTEEDEHGNQG